MTLRAPHALAAALCGGIAAANFGRLVHPAVAVLAVGIVAAAARAEGERRVALVAVGLAVAGWWWGSVRLTALDRSLLLPRVGTAERTLAEVTAPPRRTKYALRVSARVRRFGALSLHESVLLSLPPGRAPPQGALLSLVATVQLPRGPKNGFDERTWLRRHGVHVVLHADRWRLVGRRGGTAGLADRLREFVARPLGNAHGEAGDVLVGVVLGEDQGLSDDLRNRFRASGLYHLLAVSGQNVALVACGALMLVWLFGLPRFVGHLAALAGIGAYVLAVGPQPSVIRAGVVGALGSVAWFAARERDRWHFLLLAAVVLLAWSPYALLDPGFQLSFAAVTAIFVVVPPLMRFFEGYPVPRAFAAGLAVSIACGLLTAPILWLQFQAVPLLAVPANALAAPAMGPLLASALLAALIEPFAPGSAAVLVSFAGLCAAYLAWCARLVGGAPFAQVTSGRVAAALGVTALTGGAYALRSWLRSSPSI